MEENRPSDGTPRPAWSRGWGTAVARALVTVLVLGIVAEVMAFLLDVAGSKPKPSRVDFARIGGAVFYAFHHVGFVFEVPRSVLGGLGQGQQLIPLPVSARFTASLAIMGGTVLATLLLYWAGRGVGKEAGGDSLARGLQGAKIALPYAAVCLAASFGVRFSVPVGRGQLSVHPSYLAAALWPVGLALVFGFAGGFRSGPSPSWATGPEPQASWLETTWGRRARAVVAGGWWMIALGLVLSFAGLLVLAAVKPDITRAYFDNAFQGGADTGAATIAATLLVVPNMAAWVLFPAMGSCLGISGGSLGLSGSFCVLSYSQWPSGRAFAGLLGGGGIGGLPKPPVGYYAFILAPAIAVVIGGMRAARRAQAETRTGAISLGALAGVVFGLMATLALVLSIISVRAAGAAGGFSQALTVRLGPELGKSIVVAFVWGIVGGGVGGIAAGRSLPSIKARPSDAGAPSMTPPPTAPWTPPATTPPEPAPPPPEPPSRA